jgi:glycosyltransferase involved in cell wall biosynthesis
MKILLITDNHSPDSGGAEKQFFTLKELLKKQPNMAVFSIGFGLKKIYGDDFIVLRETRSKALRQCWRMFVNPVKYLQLRQLIKKINPDIIHLHNIKKYTPALLKATQNYPTIQTVHDFSCICPTQWNVHKNLRPCTSGFSLKCLWQHRRDYNFISYFALLFSFLRMRKLVKKSVNQFIAPSPFLANYLQKNHFQNSTFIFPFHSTHIATNKYKPNQNHFLYLGQLEKQKGIDFLLQEFHRALQSNHDLSLTIAGHGSQKNNIKEKIQQWHLENKIHLIDWCSNPTELYQQCCAVIFPSIGLESFGLVIIEAMAHGRAVIGSNRGPITWLVEHEKTGLLFDPLKEGDLASTILKLSNKNSPLVDTLGENAFKKSKEFSKNDAILSEIIAIYKKSLALTKSIL